MTTELRTGPLSAGSVDTGRHVIVGASAATVGPARGHGLWLDEVFLGQLVAAGNASTIRVRWSHPEGDDLGLVLGRAASWRLDGDQARCDVELTQAASVSPHGDLMTYIEAMASMSPDMIGLSVVFARDLQAEAMVAPRPDGLVTARLAQLYAVDFVGEPAANRGMFSVRCESPEHSQPPREVVTMSDPKIPAPPGATLAELKQLAPEEPAFVLAQLEIGATIEAARHAWHKHQLETQRAELESLRAELKARRQPAPDPMPIGGSAGQAAPRCDFMGEVRAKRDALFPAFAGDRFGRGMKTAMHAVVAQNPTGYAEWRRNGGR